MKKLSFLLFYLLIFAASSCKDEDVKHQIACTEVFFYVDIIFKDGAGNFIEVDDFSSVNFRTNKILHSGKSNENSPLGYYLVADDNDRRAFSREGDMVLISAKHPVSKIVKTAEIKIAADDCHINKISGPTVIVFD